MAARRTLPEKLRHFPFQIMTEASSQLYFQQGYIFATHPIDKKGLMTIVYA